MSRNTHRAINFLWRHRKTVEWTNPAPSQSQPHFTKFHLMSTRFLGTLFVSWRGDLWKPLTPKSNARCAASPSRLNLRNRMNVGSRSMRIATSHPCERTVTRVPTPPQPWEASTGKRRQAERTNPGAQVIAQNAVETSNPPRAEHTNPHTGDYTSTNHHGSPQASPRAPARSCGVLCAAIVHPAIALMARKPLSGAASHAVM